jgi:hypothetical protein
MGVGHLKPSLSAWHNATLKDAIRFRVSNLPFRFRV